MKSEKSELLKGIGLIAGGVAVAALALVLGDKASKVVTPVVKNSDKIADGAKILESMARRVKETGINHMGVIVDFDAYFREGYKH